MNLLAVIQFPFPQVTLLAYIYFQNMVDDHWSLWQHTPYRLVTVLCKKITRKGSEFGREEGGYRNIVMVFILIAASVLFGFLLLPFYEIGIAWAASCVDNCRNAENNAYIDHGIVKSCFI